MFWFLVVFIVFGCIWGRTVNEVIHNKGYTQNWFWWGFFFGLIPVIIALLLPEKYVYVKEENYFGSDDPVVPQNGVYQNFDDSKKTIGVAELSNGWKCPVCGEMNAGHAGTCSCGYDTSGNI